MLPSSGARSIQLRNDLEPLKKNLKHLKLNLLKREFYLLNQRINFLLLRKQKAKEKLMIKLNLSIQTIQVVRVLITQEHSRVQVWSQQTFITYSRIAICKLYTDKTAITSADLLNDRVLPFFAEHQIPLLRILTDRGTEYCGKVESHAF